MMKRQFAFVLVWLKGSLTAMIGSAAMADVEYELHIIEPWDTGYSLASSAVTGLNNLNQVSGSAYRESGTPMFLWTVETGKQEIDLAGHLNDHGVIATAGAVRWPDGTIEYFPWPMNGVSEVSNANVFAGATGSVHTCPSHASGREAAVWTQAGGTIRFDQDLGLFGSDQVWGINELNEVVGVQSWTGGCGDQKAFYYNLQTNEYIDLHFELTGSPSGITRMFDINNNGIAVGEGPTGGLVQPVKWKRDAGFTILPTLPGADPQYTHPNSINDHDVIVGAALSFDDWEWRAVIWEADGSVRDLNQLVELPPDFIIEGAKRINNNGWIIGRGHYGAWSPERAVVLVPIDSTPTLTGDLNGDGAVTIADITSVISMFGSTCSGCPQDINGDGAITIADINAVISAFGMTA